METSVRNQEEKRLLESALDRLRFSCGCPLQEADLDLPEQLLSVVFCLRFAMQ